MKRNTVVIEDGIVFMVGPDVDVLTIHRGKTGMKHLARVENFITRDELLEKMKEGNWADDHGS